MFDIITGASPHRDDLDTPDDLAPPDGLDELDGYGPLDEFDEPDDPGPPDRLATLDDVNVMASAIMEDVIEQLRRQDARTDDLEATVVALRKLVQQRVPHSGRRPGSD